MPERFNKWSPKVPPVGTIVQIQFGQFIFESTVLTRTTKDGETFCITLNSPFPTESTIELYITPNASAVGMVDVANNVKPYWRVAAKRGEEEQSVVVFFPKELPQHLLPQ